MIDTGLDHVSSKTISYTARMNAVGKKSFISKQQLANFGLWEKLAKKRTLYSFELELSARCNLNCRHCFINVPAGDVDAARSELGMSTIRRIADEAIALGAIWCLLSGGEPLLRRDFFEIFVALKKAGLLVSVFTNGTLITDRHVQFFLEFPPRDIEITVYGVTRETYERVTRVPGSYTAFRSGLDRLLSDGIPVTLKAMALRSNYEEMPQIARFCREFGNHDYRFDASLHLRYDGDSLRNRDIIAERLSPEQIIELEKSEPARLRGLRDTPMHPVVPEGQKPNEATVFGCGIGNDMCYVSANGMFSFCSSLRHPNFVYDLNTGSLTDAWNLMLPVIKKCNSQSRDFIENCATCPIINLCRWCPAVAHLETGCLDEPVDHFCRTAHQRQQVLNET